MLILQLIYISFAVNCPEETPYIYDQEFDVNIKENGWYYFRTNIRNENDIPLLVIAVKSDQPVVLYSSDAYECPDESFPSFLNVSICSQYLRGSNYYHSPNGMVSIGIKAQNDSHIHVRLEGQHKMRKSSKYIIKLSLTFIIMISMTGIFFFYVVLPNEMEEKGKNENEFDF